MARSPCIVVVSDMDVHWNSLVRGQYCVRFTRDHVLPHGAAPGCRRPLDRSLQQSAYVLGSPKHIIMRGKCFSHQNICPWAPQQ
jgi:hypothetical protein